MAGEVDMSSMLVGILYVVAGAAVVALTVGLTEFGDLKDKKSVRCPETGHPARVGVDARRGALGVTFGIPRLRVETCSRWPERAKCDQACREQIRGPGLVFAA
jgi:hypothetical protein